MLRNPRNSRLPRTPPGQGRHHEIYPDLEPPAKDEEIKQEWQERDKNHGETDEEVGDPPEPPQKPQPRGVPTTNDGLREIKQLMADMEKKRNGMLEKLQEKVFKKFESIS
ncbi:hypothetical protein BGX38DRAFT_1279781 [Terfezia claveryi]|nr:hypothetical protein BGX38DRAFT_1279781 [Terfezia claveryi]